MLTDAVIQHFGSQQAVADALGIKQPSVAGWGKYPPELRQLQIEALTEGKLPAESRFKQPRPKRRRAEQKAA